MDKLFQSIALVRKSAEEKSQLLLRWEESKKYWTFIVADRLNKESFRESARREVAWQLNLDKKSDFLISNMAQLSMEFVETLSDESERHTAVAFYQVHVYRKKILQLIDADPCNRWSSAAEVCQGETADGELIHPQIVTWLNQWRVVQPWQ